MNIEDKKLEIDRLYKKIYALNEEIQANLSHEILPFLKENSILVVDNWMSVTVVFNEGKETEFFKKFKVELYHWGEELGPDLGIRYDDGVTTLQFKTSGNVSGYKQKFINICLKYGLKVNFDHLKTLIEKEIKNKENHLLDVLDAEKQINQ